MQVGRAFGFLTLVALQANIAAVQAAESSGKSIDNCKLDVVYEGKEWMSKEFSTGFDFTFDFPDGKVAFTLGKDCSIIYRPLTAAKISASRIEKLGRT